MQVAPDREVALPNTLTGSLTSYRWRTRAGRMHDVDAAVSSAGPRAPPGGAELKGRLHSGVSLGSAPAQKVSWPAAAFNPASIQCSLTGICVYEKKRASLIKAVTLLLYESRPG